MCGICPEVLRYNRTYVELKFANGEFAKVPTGTGYNRTYVELKFTYADVNGYATPGYNRTYVELKLEVEWTRVLG